MIRAFQIAVLSCLGFYMVGCRGPEQSEPKPEQIKIGDLAPSHNGEHPAADLLNIVNFDVYIFEIPAENVSKLNDAWQILSLKPLLFTNYNAFRANSFMVRTGGVQMWQRVHDLLRAAGGQKIVTVSLLLPDGQANDLIVTGLATRQSISFIADNGSGQGATIGPGNLVLRIKAEKIPEARGVCKLIAYPVFTVPIISSIPELVARAKLREFVFSSAAFGLKMGPGDFVVLAPERYISDQSTLGGLFFSKPEGSLFFRSADPRKTELKPTARIFLLVCSRINY